MLKKNRQRPRIVRYILYHDPCPESSGHGYRLFSPAGWPEWAGKNRSNLNLFWRPAAGKFSFFFFLFSFFFFLFLVFGFWFLVFGFWFLVFGFARVARSIKPCRRSRCCFFRPIRSSPKFVKANSIVWMIPNERVGAWMPLGRVCVIGFGKQGISWNAGQRGWQGDTSPCIGAQGRSPA